MEAIDHEPDELDRLKARVAELNGENDGHLQELARRGVNIDASAILNVKFVALLDYLLPENWARPKALDRYPRLAYDLACQEKFREVIADVYRQYDQAKAEAEAQARKAALLAGTQGQPVPQGGRTVIVKQGQPVPQQLLRPGQ